MGAATTAGGPRLSDAAFFAALDPARPGLATVPAAVARGDFAAARRIFAAEIRATLQPERLLAVPRHFGGAEMRRPGEDDAAVAERALRLELISCGTPHRFVGAVDWEANPTYNRYREWTWQLNRHPEWAILGLRYRATGDERYAAGLAALFRSWVRQAVAPGQVPGNATDCWRTIEAGIRMGGNWAYALHCCYRSPHFTDDLLVDWYKSLWEHARRLCEDHWTHNWLIMEMNGLAQLGILCPQFRDAPAWLDYAFARLDEELACQLYPDGFQFELTTNYHQVVIRNYEGLRAVCDAYAVAVPTSFDRALERAHAVNVRLMRPDGLLPDLNDGAYLAVAPLLATAATRYPERADFRWAATAGREGRPPAENSLAFPYAGYYVMRSGWEADAIWALFDGGPFGFAHQHEDKLNLLIHAYGRSLLTEGGDYAYDDSEMRRYVLSTRAHNTIRVDGQDQQRRLSYDYRDPELLTRRADARWETAPLVDRVEAAYRDGYGPDATVAAMHAQKAAFIEQVYDGGHGPVPDRTVTHRRRVVFYKHGFPREGLLPFFLVIDWLLPTDDAPHDYQALWHLDGGAAEVRGLRARTVEPDAANLTIVAAAAPGLTLALVVGQTEPEWQGWRSTAHNTQGTDVPTPTAIYSWRAVGPAILVAALYPTPAGVSCPIEAVRYEERAGDALSVTLTLAAAGTVTVPVTAW